MIAMSSREQSVTFSVWLDADDAEKELQKIKKKILDLESELSTQKTVKTGMEEQLQQLILKADEAKERMLAMQKAGAPSPELKEQQAVVAAYDKELNAAYAALDKQNAKIAETNAQLETQRELYGHVQQQADSAGESGEKAMQRTGDATSAATQRLEKLANRVLSLAKSALVFSVMSKGLGVLRNYIGDALQTSEEFTDAVAGLKGTLLTAFMPIYTAVLPALVTLINGLTKAITVIASFVAALFGTTLESSAETAQNLYDEANALKAVGGAAGKASKQLASFDEINQLTKSGGGGGSGNSAAGALFGLSGLSDWFDNFLGSLRLSFDDVILDWSDLTGEQIAEKIIAGLGALAGAVIGFTIGGVPGAIIGTLAGASLGLVFDSLIFNHDGTLSREEILQMIVLAAGALAGGILGFVIGNVGGSAIGVLVGASLGVLLDKLVFDNDGKVRKREVIRLLVAALGAIAGGILGFAVGGPAGAAIGIVVGAGVTLVISNVLIDDDGKFKFSGKEIIIDFLDGIAEGLLSVGDWLRLNVYEPVYQGLLTVFGVRDEKSGKIAKIGSFLSLGLLDGMSLLSGNTLLNFAWGVAHIFAPLVDFIKRIFGIGSPAKEMEPLGAYIAEGLLQGFANGITDKINMVKSPLNAIIEAIETAINWIVGKINALSVTIPPVQVLGANVFPGKTIGFNIPTVSIPRLAAGAVIPPNREFLAVLGDQSRGTNIETPLETMVKAFRQALSDDGFGNATFQIFLDGEKIAENTVRRINRNARGSGRLSQI